MKKNAAIGIGGACGAVLRYFLQHIPISLNEIYRPVLTVIINVSGSFLLGFLMVLFVKTIKINAEIRVGITTGFLGGFTTFSTFCKETAVIFSSGHPIFGAVYVVCSIALGLLAAFLGISAAKLIERRRRV